MCTFSIETTYNIFVFSISSSDLIVALILFGKKEWSRDRFNVIAMKTYSHRELITYLLMRENVMEHFV